MSAEAGLISSISVEALIAARDQALRTLDCIDHEWNKAREGLQRFGVGLAEVGMYVDSHLTLKTSDAEALRYEIDRVAWKRLWEATNVDQLMDSDTRHKLQSMLHDRNHYGHKSDKLPPLTVENVRSTFAQVHANRQEYFEAAVEAVFRKLSWDYKTNRPYQFGTKMILCFGIDYSYSDNGTFSLRHASPLLDLERVLCIIAQAPPPTYNTGVQALRDVPYGQWTNVLAGNGVHLLTVKGFKNRNLHVRMAKQGHVDELNRIIAKRFPGVIGRDPSNKD